MPAPLLRVQTDNFEHCHDTNVQISRSAFHAELLRPLETKLAERGLTPDPHENEVYPLWFHLETEINIYLWKRGLSISEKSRFQFWIEPKEFIEKRLEQISHFEEHNPFLSPLWGFSQAHPNAPVLEREYLLALEASLERVCIHLHALSMASDQVSNSKTETAALPG